MRVAGAAASSPEVPIKDPDRQSIFLCCCEAQQAVSSSDISKDSLHALVQNELLPQAFAKLKAEKPCPFPAGANLKTIEREIGKLKGSTAWDKALEAQLYIRDKSKALWDMISVVLNVYGLKSGVWTSCGGQE